MSSIPVIAILDVGKTNKKFFLFDASYQIVWEESTVLEETKDEDGDPCEHLEALTQWVKDTCKKSGDSGDFDIRAIHYSAYGASLVYIGEDGAPLMPLYNYLKPFPEKIKKQFYEKYGGEEEFSLLTASPILGSLNSGMQLYRMKNEYPDRFEKIRYALHLPQYLSWLMTGKAVSDISSIGCHTGLWNFSRHAYHEWIYKEQVADKLAPVYAADTVFSLSSGRGQQSVIPGSPVSGIGLHDSSAAMIPFLENIDEHFVQISTGTWCISINPFNQEPLSLSELEEGCLCYLSHKGRQMKASRLFAGSDHELQVTRIAIHFQKDRKFYQQITYQADIISKLKESSAGFSYEPQKEIVASVFGQRDLCNFSNFEEAYHQLMVDIMHQQIESTGRIMSQGIKKIFVDGGFSKNEIYMHLLADGFSSVEVFAAVIGQASALGAALAIHKHWNEGPLPTKLIHLKKYGGREV